MIDTLAESPVPQPPRVEDAPRLVERTPGAEWRDAPRADGQFHGVILGVAGCVLALAGVLRVEGEEAVIVPVIDQPLPGVCTYQRLLGLPCPGCGLTRCFISLAHGDVVAAWHFSPAGILLFAVVAAQLPVRGVQLWRIRRGQQELGQRWVSSTAFWLCVAALLTQWLVRTVGLL
jgi:hypothetical protein